MSRWILGQMLRSRRWPLLTAALLLTLSWMILLVVGPSVEATENAEDSPCVLHVASIGKPEEKAFPCDEVPILKRGSYVWRETPGFLTPFVTLVREDGEVQVSMGPLAPAVRVHIPPAGEDSMVRSYLILDLTQRDEVVDHGLAFRRPVGPAGGTVLFPEGEAAVLGLDSKGQVR